MTADFKSEPPTPHRISEARKKGQVFRSQELNFAILLISVLVFMNATRTTICNGFISVIKSGLMEKDILHFGIGVILRKYTFIALNLITPIVICSTVTALLINIMQTGFLYTTNTLMPNLSKMNPLEGFKKIYSRRAFFELAKNTVKISLTFLIAYDFIKNIIPRSVICFHQPLYVSYFTQTKMIYDLCIRIAIFFLVISVFDYLYQKYQYFEQLKMSRQEVKEEVKQLDGDPYVKQRQREARYKQFRSGLKDVAKARVVITNPTHIACALRYEDDMDAPQLVAKGQRLMAERIIEIAKENDIHVMENKPLAWALYDNVEIGDIIPTKFYNAIAEILVFVIEMEDKNKK